MIYHSEWPLLVTTRAFAMALDSWTLKLVSLQICQGRSNSILENLAEFRRFQDCRHSIVACLSRDDDATTIGLTHVFWMSVNYRSMDRPYEPAAISVSRCKAAEEWVVNHQMTRKTTWWQAKTVSYLFALPDDQDQIRWSQGRHPFYFVGHMDVRRQGLGINYRQLVDVGVSLNCSIHMKHRTLRRALELGICPGCHIPAKSMIERCASSTGADMIYRIPKAPHCDCFNIPRCWSSVPRFSTPTLMRWLPCWENISKEKTLKTIIAPSKGLILPRGASRDC